MFEPKKNMDNPHNLHVTEDGSEIYVVELNNKKVYRFLQGITLCSIITKIYSVM